ncbi:MAG TPA: hypothetical protein VLX92_03885 [Kofleriaceae bacterium]|nr:hypothetical protein [Kofleriaceae bacterium]
MGVKLNLGLAVLLAASIAHAQAPTDDARTHFNRGTELYDANNFRGALVEFQRAYELAPNYRLLYNIGQVDLELQDYAAALTALTRYLREGGPDVPRDRLQQVNQDIERLKGRVGTVTVQTVAGAEVLVDDASVGYAPLPDPIPVNAGRHKFTVHAAGRDPVTRVIDVAGLEKLTVALALPTGDTGAVHPPAVKTITHHPHGSGLLAIAGGGVFLVGVALSVVGVAQIPSNCSLSDSQCIAAPTDPSLGSASRATRLFDIGLATSAVGLAAGVGGLIWYYSGAKTDRETMAVAPWFAPGGGGIALVGRM